MLKFFFKKSKKKIKITQSAILIKLNNYNNNNQSMLKYITKFLALSTKYLVIFINKVKLQQQN